MLLEATRAAYMYICKIW